MWLIWSISIWSTLTPSESFTYIWCISRCWTSSTTLWSLMISTSTFRTRMCSREPRRFITSSLDIAQCDPHAHIEYEEAPQEPRVDYILLPGWEGVEYSGGEGWRIVALIGTNGALLWPPRHSSVIIIQFIQIKHTIGGWLIYGVQGCTHTWSLVIIIAHWNGQFEGDRMRYQYFLIKDTLNWSW